MTQAQIYSPREIQQSFFESLGNRDWDMYTMNDYQYLKFKIAYAFYGPPTIESDIDDIENNSGYTKIQYDKILPIYDKILSFARYSANGKNIYMSILFVCKVPVGKLPDYLIYAEYIPSEHIEVYPVFKIRKCINAEKEGCSIFLDDVGRLYKNWSEYLLENVLSKGIIISPSNGRYCGSFKEKLVEVALNSSYSPACSKMAEVRRIGDVTGTVVAAGVLGVVGFSLFAPVAGAVAIALNAATLATGVYAVASSSVSLADRRKHGQNISLKDPESRGYWLNIGAGTAGAVAGVGSQILTKVASEGMVIGNGIKIAHDTAVIAAVVTGGAGFINSVGSSIIKYKETGILPNNLELFQMASSALFLTNSLINNKMASTIITENQSGIIYNFRSLLGSGKARTVFDKLVVKTQRITGQSSQGNSEVIQRIKRIDLNQLCRGALIIKKELHKRNVKMSPSNDGIPLFNGTNQADPHAFAASNSANQNEVFQNINEHQSNTVNEMQRSQSKPCYLSGIVEEFFTCPISIDKIVHSFPSLSMSEPEVFKDLCKLFSDFTEATFNLFAEIVNNVFKSTTIKLLQQSRALTMEETQLFENLILFVHSTLLYYSETHEIKIPQLIKQYFEYGHIPQLLVKELYSDFQNYINFKYQHEAGYKEIKCKECDGLRFSAN